MSSILQPSIKALLCLCDEPNSELDAQDYCEIYGVLEQLLREGHHSFTPREGEKMANSLKAVGKIAKRALEREERESEKRKSVLAALVKKRIDATRTPKKPRQKAA